MFALDPESQEALDVFCSGLEASQADYLRNVIRRVCEDPAGRRQPTHNFTRPFRDPARYVGPIPSDQKVWELKTNRYRALFMTADVRKGGKVHRQLRFVPISGQGLFQASEVPWHHG